jgi:hypothetical protein
VTFKTNFITPYSKKAKKNETAKISEVDVDAGRSRRRNDGLDGLRDRKRPMC